MPRRSGPRTSHDSNRAPLLRLDPAMALLGAVVRQALDDARSRQADVRDEALQFLRDEAALAWFGQQLGVGDDVLQERVQALLGDGGG